MFNAFILTVVAFVIHNLIVLSIPELRYLWVKYVEKIANLTRNPKTTITVFISAQLTIAWLTNWGVISLIGMGCMIVLMIVLECAILGIGLKVARREE